MGVVHLNNAGAGLMPPPVLAAIQDHLALEARIGGYEAADAAAADIEQAYADVAALLGAQARNVAVVENATVAVAQALSAFDWEPGDAVVTTKTDYVSNQLMLLSLAERRGVRVHRAADLPEGGVDPDDVRRLLRTTPRCRAVMATWVPTNSGLVQDVAAVGAACAEAGVPFILDACQAVGQLPIDVAALQCDFLGATARKFLRGPRGIGFLYVSDRMLDAGRYPLYVDMRGADWTEADGYVLADGARRFENWEFAYALVLGQGAAARYAREQDVEASGARASSLAAYARTRLAELPGARVLDRGAHRCAIVTVAFDGHDARDLVKTLRAHGINTSATLRNSGVIDMDEKDAATALRVSPHYYNTEAEVNALVETLAEVL